MSTNDQPSSGDGTAGAPGRASARAPERGRVELHAEPVGGDPACWLHRVCENCGRFIDDEFADACPACGAARG